MKAIECELCTNGHIIWYEELKAFICDKCGVLHK